MGTTKKVADSQRERDPKPNRLLLFWVFLRKKRVLARERDVRPRQTNRAAEEV